MHQCLLKQGAEKHSMLLCPFFPFLNGSLQEISSWWLHKEELYLLNDNSGWGTWGLTTSPLRIFSILTSCSSDLLITRLLWTPQQGTKDTNLCNICSILIRWDRLKLERSSQSWPSLSTYKWLFQGCVNSNWTTSEGQDKLNVIKMKKTNEVSSRKKEHIS